MAEGANLSSNGTTRFLYPTLALILFYFVVGLVFRFSDGRLHFAMQRPEDDARCAGLQAGKISSTPI